MIKKMFDSSACVKAVVPLLLLLPLMAHAQEDMVVERMPNIVKLIGTFKNEAVIDSETINEKAPCKPTYPPASLRNKEVGIVGVQIFVNADGYVSRAKVKETSGFRDLDRAAMVGFMGCKFKPVLKDGAPTASWIDVQYTWNLE